MQKGNKNFPLLIRLSKNNDNMLNSLHKKLRSLFPQINTII